MNCPKCSQTVEAAASFCGNCGQPLKASRGFRRHFGHAGTPGYALAAPTHHNGEVKATASLLLGITGLVGCVFMAAVGLALGIAGLVMGTVARSQYKKGLSMAGSVISSLAILASLGVWVYAIQSDPRLNAETPVSHASSVAPAVSAASLATPCYSAGFIDELNVANDPGSCDMNAYNGRTLSSSTNAYKVYADKTGITTANNFMAVAKNALEKDVSTNLSSFTIDTQKVATFAGSPAYIVAASDRTSGVKVVEAAVLHKVANGENIFILVHATNSTSADLDILEAQWQWK